MRIATLPKKFLVGLFTLFFILSPFQFNISPFYFFSSDLYADDYDIARDDVILIKQDTTWTKGQDLSFDKSVFIVNGATLTITEGAEVILGNKDVHSPEGFLVVSDGSLRVIGTEKSPVVFRGKDHASFYIDFNSFGRQESFLRYAVIGEGGDEADNEWGNLTRLPEWFISRAYAAGNGFATVNYYSGKVRIENTQFSNEQHPSINIDNAATKTNFPGDFLGITNSNFANKQSTIAVQSVLDCPYGSVCKNKVILKNDWFGASTGPKGLPDQNPVGVTGNGSVVDGPVVLKGFRKKMLIADPVIIVPGIMGSAQVLGTWKLDPILHSYDDLITSLETNGYEADINLFEFPYDWRRDNGTSAHYLQGMVEGVIESTSVSKVDIVAHSMGGLVARAYIEEVDGAHYDDTVDQLVTLGTPNDGSPEAYLKWEAGEGFFRLDGILAKHHFEQEAEEAGYNDNLKGYIQDRVTSVKQLLPDYSYLADISDAVREYSNNYPQNTFLEELNSDRNKNELAAINYTNIVGLTNPEKTISRIRVQESVVADQWEHGMPENFYNTNTDQGLEYGAGDETVPERSAKGVEADTVIEVTSTHGDLPTKAQCEVFRTLTGKSECSYDENIHIPNILLFNVFSPIDIQIISPSGLRVGKNFETDGIYDEIPGAYYTGFDTQNEFITIPNPEKGTYRILTMGTDSGNYRLEVSSIQEDASGDGVESMKTITGTAELNEAEEMTVNVTETNGTLSVVDQNTDDSSDNTTTGQGSNDTSDNTTTDNGSGGKSQKHSTKKKNTTVTTVVSYPLAQKFSVNVDNPSENIPIQILTSVIPSGENFRTKNVTVVTSESENMPPSEEVKYILSPLNHVFFLFW